MRKTEQRSRILTNAFPTDELPRHAASWLLDCELRRHSQQTLASRRNLTDKLTWFLTQKRLPCIDRTSVRAFLAYVTSGHQDPGGRWGNPRLTQPTSSRTAKDYHGNLRTFFRWMIEEGAMASSPMETIKPPVHRADQIQPFTAEQVQNLLLAAKRCDHPKRDIAICLFLLDTGVRASELCGLQRSHIDATARRATVEGKGGKTRSVYFGRSCAKALYGYLAEGEDDRPPGSHVFRSERGTCAGDGLTRSGLLQLVQRLGVAANVQATRCSPHTFRHTFAVEFLRSGGNVFTLQQLLGHTKLDMTNRYVALAQADMENQHREHSPVERMKKKC